jgi:DNA-binding SARP family transcriptional activator/Tfp pilus assembly protein PilF
MGSGGGAGVTVSILLLGGFEVSAGGLPLAFPTRKAEALLARIARRPGERLSRAHLAGLLWPDSPDDSGRASLRQALAGVRRVLADAGAPVASAGGDAVSLDGAGIDVDVVRLERALASPRDLAGAVALYRGPLLAGFPPVTDLFDAWVEEERALLARRVLAAVRTALAAEAIAPDDALALADAGIGLDATFEDGYRARMRLLAARGDRAAALREYERCRDALARLLAMAPGAATEALRREISASAAADARGSAGEARQGAPTLAVLPFEILSTDPSHEVFARGLEEDVLAALSRFRTLRVVASGPGRAPPRADYLLSASVRAAGGRLRVVARLEEAASGAQVFGDRVDADLADVFAMQDRVTRAVVSALALRIDERELSAALRRPPERLEAYTCWLRGMQALRRGTRESDLEARRLFERALEIDPGYARAYSGLSLSWFNDWSCRAWERWEETQRNAFRYAQEAARLDDRDHVTHCILGRILLYRREFELARDHLGRALALNPNDADVLAQLAGGYAYLGEPERGAAIGEDARALNPLHPQWYLPFLAVNHLLAGRLREALDLMERAPDVFVDSRGYLAAAYAHLGDGARARENAALFLERFRADISRGPPADPAEPVRWMLHINPFRREEDRAFVVEGLARAGLPAPARAARAGVATVEEGARAAPS